MRILPGPIAASPFARGNDLDVFWPPAAPGVPGATWPTAGGQRGILDDSASAMWALSGAGASTLQMYRNHVCGRLTNTRLADCVRPTFPALIQRLTGNTVTPENRRVAVWRFLMSLSANPATWGYLSGVIVRNNQTGSGWFSADSGAVIGQGCGIVGDGAGGWRWITKPLGASAAVAEAVPLTWPVALNEWCEVWMVFYSATATSNARYRLYLNRALALERSYNADGTGNLPTWDGGVGSALRLLAQSGHAGLELQLADVSVAMGQYDVNGAGLTGL